MAPLPKVKLRADVRLPAAVFGQTGIKITKANGRYTIELDVSAFNPIDHVEDDQIANYRVLAYNTSDDTYSLLPFNIAVSDQVIVEKTDAGDVNVGQYDNIILIIKETPEATTIYLPPSISKVGAVKIVDFAGNAGTYNITIIAYGSEKINGQSQWVLSGDGSSVVLHPVKEGWAL